MGAQELDRRDARKRDRIKPENDSPERLGVEAEASDVYSIDDLIGRVHSQIEEIEGSRGTWNERQVRFYKKRQGLRPPKSFPWPNCSNASMMIPDKIIKKVKPSYFNLQWAPELLADFIPNPEGPFTPEIEEIAKVNRHVFNHVVRRRMKEPKKRSMINIDHMCQTGRGLMKVTYDYSTEWREFHIDLKNLTDDELAAVGNVPEMNEETGSGFVIGWFMALLQNRGAVADASQKEVREEIKRNVKRWYDGETKFTFKIKTVTAHAPGWMPVKGKNLVIHGGFDDIQEATLICHKMKWLPNDLRKEAEKGKFNPAVVEEILEARSSSTTGSDNKKGDTTHDQGMSDAVANVTGSRHDSIRGDLIDIWEVCLYAKPGKSGILRKCILTYCPQYKEEALRFSLLPYFDGKWPYVDFPLEITDDGWLAPRGIPHQIDYFATGIDNKHNQRQDSITVSVSPMIKYISDQVSINNVRYIPGQGLPMKTDIKVAEPMIVPPGNTQALMEEQKMLQFMIEDYISIPDFTLTDPNAPGNQARKATEVLLKSHDRKSIFSS